MLNRKKIKLLRLVKLLLLSYNACWLFKKEMMTFELRDSKAVELKFAKSTQTALCAGKFQSRSMLI
ncbi:MAG: hypothetical protein UX94_C0002G0036 [Parcubacteria group bacterium GW2011_GWA2_47_21]|nr:MAG: hypothetical protein UX94_C0002G0036 [Parcubacteria group bacterium GW2011_GWA2_47_21]